MLTGQISSQALQLVQDQSSSFVTRSNIQLAGTVISASTPSGGVVTGRAYKRLPTCVGKNAEVNQAAFNILAFHPNKWAGDTGEITVYQVKEHADGTTDVTKSGKNFPNFSVSKEALKYCEISVERDHGIWVRDGDSNVPLTVWDQVSGQTEEDAVEWDWLARRAELQPVSYTHLTLPTKA